jgi:outer membrane protein assembly factor BamB
LRVLAGILALVTLTACANSGIREKPVAMPAVLPDAAELRVDWMHILGEEQARKAFGQLRPSTDGTIAYVPLASGQVFELDVEGAIKRQTQVSASLSAPLAVDGQHMVAISGEGMALLLDRNYKQLWSFKLNALATEPALMTPERIFIQTIDGRISAIERITGRLLWVFQDAEPNLTLTGTSGPELVRTGSGEAVVMGLANGKVVALSTVDGAVIWEYRIARSSGKTDVSRLVDVDAHVTVIDERLFLTGYQGDLVAIETESGRVLQATGFSSYRAIQTDGQWLFGVNAQSHVVALDPFDLSVRWTASDFEYRQLSELLVQDGLIYVADVEGYLHVLDSQTGQWLTSRQIDWRGSNSDPVAFADGVLLQGYSTRVKLLQLMRP